MRKGALIFTKNLKSLTPEKNTLAKLLKFKEDSFPIKKLINLPFSKTQGFGGNLTVSKRIMVSTL